jgi:hypothetical protein
MGFVLAVDGICQCACETDDKHDAAEYLLSVVCAVLAGTQIIWPQMPQKRHMQAWW